MKFGLVHRIMTDALAALGVLALVTGGQFSRWASGVILLGLVLALSVRESWQRHAVFKYLDTVALVAVVVLQLARVALGASVLDVMIEFAAALQLIRLSTRRGAAHDQQVIVLALLHLIAGTVLGGGLGYGLCFVGVVIVAPGALVLSHLRREVEGNYRQGARDRTGLPVDVPRILRSRRVVGKGFLAVTCLLSIPIFLFTALLFIAFPRVGLSILLVSRQTGGRMVGFSNRVDLGEVGVLRSDPTLAMRVEIPDLPDPPPTRLALHLRGTALDAYDGRTWSQSITMKRPAENDGGILPLERFPDPASDRVMRIELEPIDPPVLFLPPEASGLRFRPRGQLVLDGTGGILRGAEGEIRYSPVDERGVKYEVFLSAKRRPSFTVLAPGDRARYLSLPADLPQRVRSLAAEWTKSAATPMEKARAIESKLRTEYAYDLGSPSGKASNPLDHFLFESRRGHCEYYSTAMAVMLRAVGVPTRNVTGFSGGTYNRFGRFYAVRQGDAHSWVEAYVDGSGWLTFDPTPPSDAAPTSDVSGALAFLRDLLEATSQRWDMHVVGYDLRQQVSLLQRIRQKSPVSAGGATTAAGKLRGALAVAGAVAAAALAWRLLRGKKPSVKGAAEGGAKSPSALLATALYEELEGVLTRMGTPRMAATPPLRHARALAALEHPAAPEVLELTEQYLRARFGGEPFAEAEARAFEARVKALREQFVAPKKGARAGAASGLV